MEISLVSSGASLLSNVGNHPSAKAVRPDDHAQVAPRGRPTCPAGPCAGQLRWDRLKRLLTCGIAHRHEAKTER
jgi:hypothetical protein